MLAIVGWLREQGALTTAAEANALLEAAGMASLRASAPSEATLLLQLGVQPEVELAGAARSATLELVAQTRNGEFDRLNPGVPHFAGLSPVIPSAQGQDTTSPPKPRR